MRILKIAGRLPIQIGVTARSVKLIASSVLFVALIPTLLTLADATPMGWHDGFALAIRLASMLIATVLLGGVVAYAGALYWVRVVAPAPRRRSIAQ